MDQNKHKKKKKTANKAISDQPMEMNNLYLQIWSFITNNTEVFGVLSHCITERSSSTLLFYKDGRLDTYDNFVSVSHIQFTLKGRIFLFFLKTSQLSPKCWPTFIYEKYQFLSVYTLMLSYSLPCFKSYRKKWLIF